jgi:hypothetical protein
VSIVDDPIADSDSVRNGVVGDDGVPILERGHDAFLFANGDGGT